MDKLTIPKIGLPRVTLAGHKQEDVNIEHGKALDISGNELGDQAMSVVGFVPRPKGCNYVKWGNLRGRIRYMCEYLPNGAYVDYWTPSQNPRTVKLNPLSTQIKATFESAYLDYAYIVDTTNHKFIWRGKKVPSDIATIATLDYVEDDLSELDGNGQ